jgi:hypothetical protein
MYWKTSLAALRPHASCFLLISYGSSPPPNPLDHHPQCRPRPRSRAEEPEELAMDVPAMGQSATHSGGKRGGPAAVIGLTPFAIGLAVFSCTVLISGAAPSIERTRKVPGMKNWNTRNIQKVACISMFDPVLGIYAIYPCLQLQCLLQNQRPCRPTTHRKTSLLILRVERAPLNGNTTERTAQVAKHASQFMVLI